MSFFSNLTANCFSSFDAVPTLRLVISAIRTKLLFFVFVFIFIFSHLYACTVLGKKHICIRIQLDNSDVQFFFNFEFVSLQTGDASLDLVMLSQQPLWHEPHWKWNEERDILNERFKGGSTERKKIYVLFTLERSSEWDLHPYFGNS